MALVTNRASRECNLMLPLTRFHIRTENRVRIFLKMLMVGKHGRQANPDVGHGRRQRKKKSHSDTDDPQAVIPFTGATARKDAETHSRRTLTIFAVVAGVKPYPNKKPQPRWGRGSLVFVGGSLTP
jgi:hypothetical protein